MADPQILDPYDPDQPPAIDERDTAFWEEYVAERGDTLPEPPTGVKD